VGNLEPYFAVDGDMVVARRHASSVWSEQMVGGRPLASLVAWGAERQHGGSGWQPTRLTVDMFRPAPMRPLRVTSLRVRDGSLVRACDVFVHDGETLVSRGSALFIRQGAEPEGMVWSPPGWPGPMPDEVPASAQAHDRVALGEIRYATAIGAPTKRLVWLREHRDLVDGEAATPFVNVAGMADFAHPLSNSGDSGLGYINTDVTLYLARMPEGDWVGLETIARVSAHGVAVGGVALHDTSGLIGYAQASAVADSRLRDRHSSKPEA
jgi:hypothetical protein